MVSQKIIAYFKLNENTQPQWGEISSFSYLFKPKAIGVIKDSGRPPNWFRKRACIFSLLTRSAGFSFNGWKCLALPFEKWIVVFYPRELIIRKYFEAPKVFRTSYSYKGEKRLSASDCNWQHVPCGNTLNRDLFRSGVIRPGMQVKEHAQSVDRAVCCFIRGKVEMFFHQIFKLFFGMNCDLVKRSSWRKEVVECSWNQQLFINLRFTKKCFR